MSLVIKLGRLMDAGIIEIDCTKTAQNKFLKNNQNSTSADKEIILCA